MVEQQRDQAAVAPSADAGALPAAASAAISGVRLGVSSRPALPTPDADSVAPEEQATLIGSLAPHIEPRAVRRADTDVVVATSASPPRAMDQTPKPTGTQPTPSTPSDAPDAAALASASGPAVAPHAPEAPEAPEALMPPAMDQSPPPPPSSAVAVPMPPAVDQASPPLPPPWQAPAVRQPLPGHAPPAPARSPAHVPWQAAESWGATTITIEANTAAGASYLLWWLSGLLIYFNERHNRFVRFHAMQSILLTGALTVFAVLAGIVSALCGDVAQYARDPLIRHLFGTLGWGILVMAGVIVLFVWVPAMVAAWAGNYLRLPIVGRYAERYSAPPIEPTQPPLY